MEIHIPGCANAVNDEEFNSFAIGREKGKERKKVPISMDESMIGTI
jgi:hypothetical protein